MSFATRPTRPFRCAANKRKRLDRVRWPGLVYVAGIVAFARLRRRVGPPPAPVTIAVCYSVPLAVLRALPRGRVRTCSAWLAHMWAYKVAFETPYDRPDQLRRRLRITQPIAIDRRIGCGTPPTQRLQQRLRYPPRLTGLDKALTTIYLMWEVEPHLALAWLLARHPSRFPAAALRMALTFDSTLVGYFATPTAPPWWASEFEGHMGGNVHRVTAEVLRAIQGKPRPGTPQDHQPGANPWAAWPSDHFGSALSAAFALAEADPRVGAAGFAYAGALGLALVYTGEHYVIDLLLGGALALAIHVGTTVLTPSRLRSRTACGGVGPLTRLGRGRFGQ